MPTAVAGSVKNPIVVKLVFNMSDFAESMRKLALQVRWLALTMDPDYAFDVFADELRQRQRRRLLAYSPTTTYGLAPRRTLSSRSIPSRRESTRSRAHG